MVSWHLNSLFLNLLKITDKVVWSKSHITFPLWKVVYGTLTRATSLSVFGLSSPGNLIMGEGAAEVFWRKAINCTKNTLRTRCRGLNAVWHPIFPRWRIAVYVIGMEKTERFWAGCSPLALSSPQRDILHCNPGLLTQLCLHMQFFMLLATGSIGYRLRSLPKSGNVG